MDISKLTPIELMFGEDLEQTQELVALFEEAELYISSFVWCERIKAAYFGLGVSAFIGIFLFEIEPSEESAGRFHWVVSGDVPPACIATADCPNPALALHKYIGQKKDWCETVLNGASADPERSASVESAVEAAQELMKRISLLDTVVLNQYRDELV